MQRTWRLRAGRGENEPAPQGRSVAGRDRHGRRRPHFVMETHTGLCAPDPPEESQADGATKSLAIWYFSLAAPLRTPLAGDEFGFFLGSKRIAGHQTIYRCIDDGRRWA
jgi:hypothetical protein